MSDKKHRWTNYFIDHPIWAFVLCALLVLLGLKSINFLQIRRFPSTELGQISISAVYPGASADLMQTRVTQPLQRAVAAAEGIDYLASTTQDSATNIEARLKVGASIDEAFNTILAQVQSANSQLPPDMEPPVITKGTGNNIALLYIAYSFNNSTGAESPSELYHYLNTIVRPMLSTVPGIGAINILGAQPPAVRVWLNPIALQQYQITPSEIASAIQQQNFSLPSGTFESGDFRQPLRLDTQLRSIEELSQIPIKQSSGQIVTLADLAHMEVGSKNNDSIVLFNDQVGVFLSVEALPSANATDVVKATRVRLKELEKVLPAQLGQKIVYDATLFINDSIKEVLKTIVEASAIVVVVIYLFLGSARAMLIPIAAIPLSLIGMIALMPMFSMSFNLLTLLGMILAIGLVVDDAILVVEHYVSLSKQQSKTSAINIAKKTIHELQSPLIVMTIILALAFSPLVFLSGLTGDLFREFALTLAGSVLVSGVVALCMSPILCAKLFQGQKESLLEPSWLIILRARYSAILEDFFAHRLLVVLFLTALSLLIMPLTAYLPQELAPAEDQGFTLLSYRGPNNASLSYLEQNAAPLNTLLKNSPITSDYFLIHGAGGDPSSGFGGLIAKPWSERSLSMEDVGQELQRELRNIPGLEVFAFTPSSLPTPDGLPFQWVLYGPFSFETLYEKSQKIIEELSATGYFPFISTNFQFRKMNYTSDLNRSVLALNNQSPLSISSNILLSLTDSPIAQILYKGESIDCILRLKERPADDIIQSWPLWYERNLGQTLTDISTFSFEAEPNVRPMFNQMPSITIIGALYPTADLDELISKTQAIGDSLADEGFFNDYTGPTRSYLQEKGQLLSTGIIALIIIYLALLALYETWLDPFLILLTVPLALSGALFAMLVSTLVPFMVSVTSNIYTQLGLLTLLGLITKHGILLIQVAQEYRRVQPGLSFEQAAKRAAVERFRPIIMTTGSMVVGVLPLLFATGPGAVSRFHLGFVIASGLSIGTLFTIFLLPVTYTLAHSYFEPKQDKD